MKLLRELIKAFWEMFYFELDRGKPLVRLVPDHDSNGDKTGTYDFDPRAALRAFGFSAYFGPWGISLAVYVPISERQVGNLAVKHEAFLQYGKLAGLLGNSRDESEGGAP